LEPFDDRTKSVSSSSAQAIDSTGSVSALAFTTPADVQIFNALLGAGMYVPLASSEPECENATEKRQQFRPSSLFQSSFGLAASFHPFNDSTPLDAVATRSPSAERSMLTRV